MATVVVTLGGVAFRDFEIPETIMFGGVQRLVVHQPVGGGRIVDVLGPAEQEIGFAGVFSGPDAEMRAQTLDAARDAGLVLPLIWGGFAYSVVVASFAGAYRKPWWIPFEIRLVPVLAPVSAVVGALAQAGLDIASAAGFSGLSGVSLATVNSTDGAGGAVAQAALGSAIDGAGSVLQAAGATFAGGIGASQAAGALSALSGAAATLAGAAAASAYLGRAIGNFALGAP